MPFFLGSGDLVADPRPGDLPLELAEGEPHVERQPSKGACSIELLRYRNKRHTARVEPFHDGLAQKTRSPALWQIDSSSCPISFFKIGLQREPLLIRGGTAIHIQSGAVFSFVVHGGREVRRSSPRGSYAAARKGSRICRPRSFAGRQLSSKAGGGTGIQRRWKRVCAWRSI